MRLRGVEVVVDTAQSAEFDIANLGLRPDLLNVIERSFRKVPDARDDDVVKDIRVRVFGDLDVGYVVTRLNGEVVVTLISVRRRIDGPLAQKLRRLMGIVAVVRGAFGV